MARRDVSGRYRGRRHGFEVQLRVDVDGARPMHRVSADYYRVSGRESTYVGSMRVDEPIVSLSGLQVTIIGAATFSLTTKCTRVRVTIPLVSLRSAPKSAILRHLAAPGAPTTVYECRFESASLRALELEEACEKGVKLPGAYDTAALPSGGARRNLTHVDAFAEAGIEMLSTGSPTVIDTSAAGPNATWSDAELHAAMEEHFSRWGDRPRWAIWLLHAASHDDASLAGFMFDVRGLQRQGCAVFYGTHPDTSAEGARDRLYACVHELGHGFNLPHCWQKSLTEPPIPSRPDARSWMNYPHLFPGGEDAYWPDFGFGFDDPELMHLRHAFESNVIMGGEPFAGAGMHDRTPGWDIDERGDPGLRLKLSAPRALAQGVPVTVGLELSATTRQSRLVPPVLGPRPRTVEIAIRGPSGTEFVFEPLLHHCRGDEMIPLRAGDAPVRDHAFIHYGKGGFAFDRPGRYLVRARYAPPGGPIVLSTVASIRVRAPTTRADRQVAELIAGDEQVGTLMSLMGSDARTLQRGNNRLKEVIERHPTHPLADVARLVQAANLAHGFKRVDPDGSVEVREPRMDEAAALVAGVLEFQHSQVATAGAPGGVDRRRAPEASVTQVRIRPGIDPSVDGFVNSRIKEIVDAVPAGRTPMRRGPESPEANVPSRTPTTGESARALTSRGSEPSEGEATAGETQAAAEPAELPRLADV